MVIYSKNKVRIRITEERLNHIFTNHPEITEFVSEILKVINNPDFIFEGETGEQIAVKRIEKFFLVVIYREENKEGFIITAFKTRSINYLFKRKPIWKKD